MVLLSWWVASTRAVVLSLMEMLQHIVVPYAGMYLSLQGSFFSMAGCALWLNLLHRMAL